jgi:hypothetical protein
MTTMAVPARLVKMLRCEMSGDQIAPQQHATGMANLGCDGGAVSDTRASASCAILRSGT